MGLSCSCDWECDTEPGSWAYVYTWDVDFKRLNTSKRKRCCSCKKLINIGDPCIEYARCRQPYNEIEAKIWGLPWESLENPEIPIASHYHCEKCGEIYLNLGYIGYECLIPNENMPEMLREYQEMTGFEQGGKE